MLGVQINAHLLGCAPRSRALRCLQAHGIASMQRPRVFVHLFVSWGGGMGVPLPPPPDPVSPPCPPPQECSALGDMPGSFVPTVTAITSSQDLQWLVQPTLISSVAQTQPPQPPPSGGPMAHPPPPPPPPPPPTAPGASVDPYDLPGPSYSAAGMGGFPTAPPARATRARARRSRDETVSGGGGSLNLVPKPGPQTWSSNLEPKPGAQTWSPDLDPKPGAQTWSPNLEPKPGAQTWSPDLDPKPGPQTWSPNLDPKPGPQTWTPNLVPKPGPETWSPNLDLKPGPQTWTPNLGAGPQALFSSSDPFTPPKLRTPVPALCPQRTALVPSLGDVSQP